MVVPSSFPAVKAHLDQVQNDPSISLDTTLLDKLKIELTENVDPSVPATLLTQIPQLLPVLQEDPTPLTVLGTRATVYFSFADLRSIEPSVNFVAGFKAPSPPINLLALSLLEKAGQIPSDAAIVAGDSELVASLVELWLSTSSTEVAQAALDTIWALLEIDNESPRENGGYEKVGGQGLVWRRIFTDKDVYGTLFSICSLSDNGPGNLPKRDKTVAQGRLMGLLERAGRLRWDIISTSQVPEIESKYQSNSLLHFAACQMVDKSDILMHMTLLKFFRDILEIDAPGLVARSYVQSASTFSSPALDFLIAHNIHPTVLEYYLDESKLDPVDLSFLYGPVMTYVAQYTELYPNHFLQNQQSLSDRILERVIGSLRISSMQWAHGQIPSGQLNVLCSLPRVLLVEASKQGLNPMLALPTNPPSKEALNALARILHGPQRSSNPNSTELNSSGQTPTDWHKEAAAARFLYFTYLNHHPSLWKDIVASADILVMKDVSLASMSFMQAIVTANWQTLIDEVIAPVPGMGSRFQLPSEQSLGSVSPSEQGSLPASGSWAVLTPPALLTLLPYLFKPPRSYAEFVGGGAGDAENAVWKIATAKYDVLVTLHDRMKELDDKTPEFEDIVRTLQQRVRDGPLGPATRTVPNVETIGL
ncbi:uncharacterized protein ASPGLDRAFT_43864 [Aspergillus glaucus CBS 516.65]|uniref:DNA mismatch repair protein HSM3 N-terminal domain-containing protein n=1 Tax=Aspergillus glaucus CBS 516.65 TaxID=1160497 RepID=A0A1L9VTS0_ASPGL|nr:hypothetical protein ASPGLDRAFT_43864 [Aspergillus glaucus CBS 516.65]OJJ87328.1 hypothetical protein ASPGLDRAFT_43864 [Aspergillus glaucus CBS 516.65]